MSLSNKRLEGYDDDDDDDGIVAIDQQKLLLQKSVFKRVEFQHFFPTRYVLTLMGFWGFFNLYALRVTLNVAIVAMVNSSKVEKNVTMIDECPLPNNENSTSSAKEGVFQWDEKIQGIILGSFYYGYVVTQIPGGRMSEIYGSKWLFGGCLLITSVLSLLIPVLARLNVMALIAARILQGLVGGPSYPAMHSMLGRWLPLSQRSLLSSIIYMGAEIGTMVSELLTGILCDSDILGGWPSAFYFLGIAGIIWFILWMVLIFDSPEKHPRISEEELQFIQTNQGKKHEHKQNIPIPWRNILTSLPVWMLIVTHFGQDWGFSILLTELPTYMKNILHFDFKTNGLLSSLPYLFRGVFGWIAGCLADLIRGKGYIGMSGTRKIFNTIGCIGPALCLIGVVYAGCNNTLNAALFTLAMGFSGFSYAGYLVTHMDLSPDFAGTLMGLSNGLAQMTGFIAPAFVGSLIEHNETFQRWSIVFYTTSVVYVIAAILFVIFGSAELQPWGVVVSEETDSTEEDTTDNCLNLDDIPVFSVSKVIGS
ncbi:putative inorganic phosphate cotransporter [Limulus polyphemus]|uniref:Inorganic phosphate cotransporter n=1 Tax=Limulus polyphemus TaxID=6850 RepID=A0ABM1S6X4_LIMPO|nr:putative inorganic phosphate cotransporter [Limulus polyphemus]